MEHPLDEYVSPYTYRYGSPELRYVWSEEHTRFLWHQGWLNQLMELGKMGSQAVNMVYLRKRISDPVEELAEVHRCYRKAVELEKKTKHDLVAHLTVFEETLPKDIRGLVHLGLTSSDIEDWATGLQIMESMQEIASSLSAAIFALYETIGNHSRTLVLGRTHLQPAEPTTLGYRLLSYGEQLTYPATGITSMMRNGFATKLLTGAVGTGANWNYASSLIDSDNNDELGPAQLRPVASGQTTPRQEEMRVAHILSDVACTLHKMGLDMRLMAMEPWYGSVEGTDRVGSSAMPGKVNPIRWEKVCSLSRHVEHISHEIWEIGANQGLERTLDDSASRRSLLPEMFLALQDALNAVALGVLDLRIDVGAATRQVMENWQSWIPSRALALMQVQHPEIPRHALHRDIEECLSHSEGDIVEFWSQLGLSRQESVRTLWISEATTACDLRIGRLSSAMDSLTKVVDGGPIGWQWQLEGNTTA